MIDEQHLTIPRFFLTFKQGSGWLPVVLSTSPSRASRVGGLPRQLPNPGSDQLPSLFSLGLS